MCGENSSQVTLEGGRVEMLHLADDGVWLVGQAVAFLPDSNWVMVSHYQLTALGFICSSLEC